MNISEDKIQQAKVACPKQILDPTRVGVFQFFRNTVNAVFGVGIGLMLSVQLVYAYTNISGEQPLSALSSNYFVDKQVQSPDVLVNALLDQSVTNGEAQNGESVFHLFSHGAPGQLLVDGQWLSGDLLVEYLRPMVEGYKSLNIYGCEFAKGDRGEQAVSFLEAELGIQVAASDDITGIDGDWDLEVGQSNASISLASYDHNLQTSCGIPNEFGFIEDLIQSGFHSGLYRTQSGYAVAGSRADPTASSQTLLTDITPANGYNYTGTILFATSGSISEGGSAQYLAITDDNKLWAWGTQGLILDSSLTTSVNFAEVPLGLPTGVTAADVAMLKAAGGGAVALLTTDGRVFLTGSNNFSFFPDSTTVWNEKISSQVFVDIDIADETVLAVNDAGDLYTWGVQTYLGDGSASAYYGPPTLMPTANYPWLAAGASIVQAEISNTHELSLGAADPGSTYYILASNGKIYTLGEGHRGILGNGNTTDQATWQTVQNTTNTGDLTDVVFISASDNSNRRVGVSAILSDRTLLSWGNNDNEMTGLNGASFGSLPAVPNGFVQGTNMAFYVENGGHLTPYLEVDTVCNVGHNSEGGFGDGTSADQSAYSCRNLPVDVCASPQPALSISKTAMPSTGVSVGDTVTYTMVVENTGLVPATEIVVTDNLPGDVSYVSESTELGRPVATLALTVTDDFETTTGGSGWAAGWTLTGDTGGSGSDIEFGYDDTADGSGDNELRIKDDNNSVLRQVDLSGLDRAELTLDYRRDGGPDSNDELFIYVTGDFPASPFFCESLNTVGAGWTKIGYILGDGGSDATFLSLPAISLPASVLTSDAGICLATDNSMGNNEGFVIDDLVITGQTVSYEVSDNIPAGTNSDLANGVPPSLVVASDSVELLPGEIATVTFDVTVDAGANGTLTNTAIANATSLPMPVDDTADITVDVAEVATLTIDKTSVVTDTVADGFTGLGDTVTYSFLVTAPAANTVAINNLTVNDPTLAALTPAPTITCPVTTLAPGASTTCTASDYITTTADVTAGEIENTATASGTTLSGTTTSPPDTETITIGASPAPDLTIIKSVYSGQFSTPVAINDTIVYQFVVENTGNVTINNVVPVDGGIEVDGVAGTGTSSAISPASADLAPGESQVYTMAYSLSAADVTVIGGSADSKIAITNTATATGTPMAGTLPVIPESSAITGPEGINMCPISNEFIVNGGFEQGNVGFTSDYTIVNPCAGGLGDSLINMDPVPIGSALGEVGAVTRDNGNLIQDGNECEGHADSFIAPTQDLSPSGDENYLLVNSFQREDGGVLFPGTGAPSVVWRQTVSGLEPGEAYQFSMFAIDYIRNFAELALSQIAVKVDGVEVLPSSVLPRFNLSGAGDQDNWSKFVFDLVADADGEFEIEVLSTNVLPALSSPLHGEDFAIDSLSLKKACLTPSLEITKTLITNIANVVPGDTFTYSLTVENPDPSIVYSDPDQRSTAFDISLEDSLGGGQVAITGTGVQATGSPTPGAGTFYNCSTSAANPDLDGEADSWDLEADQSITCLFDYALTASDVNNGSLSNTGTVVGLNASGSIAATDIDTLVTPLTSSCTLESVEANYLTPVVTHSSVTGVGSAVIPVVRASDSQPLGTVTLNWYGVNDGVLPAVDLAPTINNGYNLQFTYRLRDVDGINYGYSLSVQDIDFSMGNSLVTHQLQGPNLGGGMPGRLESSWYSFSHTLSENPEIVPSPPTNYDPSDGTYSPASQRYFYHYLTSPTLPVAGTPAAAQMVALGDSISNGTSIFRKQATGAGVLGPPLDIQFPISAGQSYSVDAIFRDDTTNTGRDTTTFNLPYPNIDLLNCDITGVILSGNVFEDADGLTNSTVDGVGTNVSGALFATLLDSSGSTVIASVAVASDGSFSFANVTPSTDYIVQLGTVDETAQVGSSPSAVPSLPSTWINTGENIGTAAGNDGTVNGLLPVSVATSDVAQVNFAIQQLTAGLTMVKSITSGSSYNAVGDIINYSFLVTNSGGLALAGPVTIDDDKTTDENCPPVTSVGNGDANLDPSEVITCTASYTVTQADIDAGSVVNVASASADGTTSPTDTETATGVQTPSLSLVKSSGTVSDVNGNGFTDAGDTVAYSFEVFNTGNVNLLLGATISDAMLSGATPAVTVTCPANTVVAPGASSSACTASGPYTLTQADIDAGGIENTSSIDASPVEADGTTPIDDPNNTGNALADVSDTSDTGTDADGTTVTDPQDSETSGVVDDTNGDGGLDSNADANNGNDATPLSIAPVPQLQVTKSISSVADTNGNGITDAGDTISYSFSVTNTGNVALSPVTISDAKLGLTDVACVATLAVGDTDIACSSTGSYVIMQVDVEAGGIENVAIGTGSPVDSAGNPIDDPNNPGNPLANVTDTSDAGTDSDGDPITDPDTIETPNPLSENPNDTNDPTDDPTTLMLSPMPALEVTKSVTSVTDVNGNGITDAGDTVEYSFSVENTGSTSLSPVTITDAKLGLTDAACADTLSIGETEVCSTTGSYTLLQSDIDAGGIENVAIASGTPVDANGDPLDDPANPGTPLANVSDTSDTGTDADGNAITDPDTVETDNPLAENSNDVNDPKDDPTTLNIAPAPSLSLVKSSGTVSDVNSNGFTDAGDTVAYSFEVFNTGNVNLLLDTTITDAMLAGATPAVTVTCPANTVVAPGASSSACTADGPYTLTQADIDAGGIENTSSMDASPVEADGTTPIDDPNNTGNALADVSDTSDTGTDADGTTVTDPQDNETSGVVDDTNGDGGLDSNADANNGNDATPLSIAPVPQLQVTKSISSVADTNGNGITDAGDTISYSFSVTNTGNVALSPVTITDSKLGLTDVACVTTLAVGDTDIACSSTGSYVIMQVDVEAGGIENVAIGTGSPVDSAGNPIDDPNNPGSPLANVTDTSDAGTDSDGDPITDPDTIETPNPLSENPNDTNDPTDDPTTLMLSPMPALEITKSVTSVTDVNGNGITDAGDTVEYSFSVENTGSATLAPVTISDAKLGLTDAACAGSLVPGETEVCSTTGSYTLLQSDIDAGGIENVATATGTPVDANGDPLDDPANPGTPLANVSDTSDTGTDVDGNAITDPDTVESPNPLGENSNDVNDPKDDPTTLNIAPAPSLSLVKSSGTVSDVNSNGFTDAGDTVAYSFEVFNTGNVNLLLGATITDAMLSGATPAVTVTCPANTVVAPGASSSACTASGPYTLTQADIDAGGIENTSSMDASPVEADGTTPIDDPNNTGNALADVSDTSDTGTDADGTTVTDPQDNETSGVVDDTNGDGGLDSNADANNGNDATPLNIAPVPQLQVTKSISSVADTNGNGITDAGDTISYSFSVTNTGNVALSPVTITDSKLGLTDVACVTTLAVGDTDIACSSTGSYVIMQVDVEAGGIENVAIGTGSPVDSAGNPIADPNNPGNPLANVTDTSDSGTDSDGDPITDPDTIETPNPLSENPNDTNDPTDDPTTLMLSPMPALEVTKSVTSVTDVNGNGITDAGDTVEYSFSVENTGSATLAPVTISDAKLGLTDAACAGSLVPGETEVCSTTGSYTLLQSDIDAGGIENVATATGTPVDANGDPLDDPANPGTPLANVSDTSDTGTDADGNAITDPDTVESPNPLGENSNDVNDPKDDPTTLNIAPAPSLSLVKSSGTVSDLNSNGFTDAGDTVAYSFEVFNTGNVNLLLDTTITDAMLSGATPAVTVTCPANTVVAPGASSSACTASGPYTLTQADIDAGGIENTSSMDASPVEADGTTPIDDPNNTGNALADVSDTSDTGTDADGTTVTDPQDNETSGVVDDTNGDGGLDSNADANNGNDATPLNIAPVPQLQVTKSISSVADTNGNGITDAGDTISYSFSVTNTGNVALSPVTITDSKLGLTDVACVTTLAVGDTDIACSSTGSYVIMQVDVEAGGIENVAIGTGSPVDSAGNPIADPNNPGNPLANVTDTSDSGTDSDGDPITDPETVETPNPLSENPNDTNDPTDDPTTLMLSPMPALEVTKSVTSVTDVNGNGITDAGDTVEYSFSVENTGSATLAPVTISDAKLGLTDAACAGSLVPGETEVCSTTGSYTLLQSDIDAGGIENVATATGTPVDANGDPLDDPANPGTPLANVSDTSDTGTDADGNAITDPDTVESPNPLGENTNDVNDPKDDPTTLNIAPAPSLSLVKSSGTVSDLNSNGFTDAGDTVAYSFEMFNTGNVNLLLDTTITDAMLSGATPAVTVTCPANTVVAPGASSSACTANGPYTLTQADVDAGGIENTSSMDASPVEADGTTPIDDPANPGNALADISDMSDSGTDADGNTVTDPQDSETSGVVDDTNGDGGLDSNADANNGNDATPLSIAPVPQLQVTKSISSVADTNGNGITDAGDTISYSFSVTNTGNVALSPVTVTDAKLGLTDAACVATLAVGDTDIACSSTGSYVIMQVDVEAGGIENVAIGTGSPVDSAGNPIDDLNNPGNPLANVTDTSDSGSDANGDPITDPETVETPNPLSENPNDTNDPTDDPTTLMLSPMPALEVTKSVTSVTDVNGNGITDAGDTVEYSFSVENTGSTTLAPVTISDAKLGLTDAACAGSLVPGETEVCSTTGSYTLLQSDIDAGGIENVATATGTPVDANGDPLDDPANPGTPLSNVSDTSDTGTDVDGNTITDPDTVESPNPLGENSNDVNDPKDDPTTLNIAPAPSLSLVKSSGTVSDVNSNGFTDAGDTVAYSFEVFNTGNVNLLLGATITDAMLSGATPAVTVTCPANTVVAPGASSSACTASGPYTLTQADIDAGGIENTSSMDASPVEADGTTPIDDPNNTGNALADVSDTSDTGTDADGNTVTDPQDSETSGVVDDTNGDGGLDSNADANNGNDATPLSIAPVPQLQVTKSISSVADTNGNGITDAGDTISYSFSVTNTGNVALSPVMISDAKLGLTDVACVTTLAVGDTDIACSSTGSYVIMQVDVEAGGIENVAIGTGSPVDSAGNPIDDPNNPGNPLANVTDTSDAGTDSDGDPITDPDTIETPNPLSENPNDTNDPTDDPTTLMLSPMPALEVTKSVTSVTDVNGNGITDAGDTVEYSFSVENTGSATLAPVTISDAKLGLTDAACAGSLVPGETEVCSTTGSYTLLQSDIDAGGIENVATATGTPVDANGDPLDDPANPGTPLANVSDTSDTGTDVDGNAITDPDTVESPNPLGENSNDVNDPKDDPTTLNIAPAPSLSLVKSSGTVSDVNSNGFADAGDTVAYSFEVFNTGNVNLLLGATITDAMLSGATPAVTVTCPANTVVAPGASSSACTASGPYTLTQADIDAGGIENTSSMDASPVEADGTTPIDDPNNTGNALADVSDTSDTGTDADGTTVTDPQDNETSGVVDDTNGDGGLDSNADANNGNDATPLNIAPVPQLQVTKSISSVADTNGNGITDAGDTISYSFSVTNTGNVALSPVTITDSKLGLTDVACVTTLAVGDTDIACSSTGSYVIMQVDVEAGGIENVAIGTGTPVDSAGNPIADPNNPGNPLANATDTSDSGTDSSGSAITDPETVETPNPLGDNTNDTNDPTDDPTTLMLSPMPALEVTKSVTSVTDVNGNGITDAGDTVEYSFSVENTGSTTLAPVTITDAKLGLTNAACIGSLAIGETAVCSTTGSYTILESDILAGGVENVATASGTPVDANGDPLDDPANPGTPLADVTDTSDTGTDVDGNTITDPDTVESPNPLGENSNDVNDPKDDPTTIMLTPAPEIGVVKSASVGPLKGDGTVDVTYTILVENTGNVSLSPLTLVDDLTAVDQLGSAFNGVITAPAVTLTNTSSNSVEPSGNAAYDGTDGLLLGTDGSLVPGDTYQVVFTVNVNPLADQAPDPLANTATAGGSPAGGLPPVTDDSNTGTDPDGDPTGEEPTDNPGGPGSPTIITVPDINPSLIVSKSLDGAPVDLGAGVFRVTFNLVVVNDGDVDFTDLQLEDDLVAMVNNPQANGGSVSNAEVSYVSGTVLTPSASYTGTGVNELLAGTDAFPVDAESTLALAFDFTPAQYFGPFNNIAMVSGVDPTGTTEEDLSENSVRPVSTGGNGDFNSETPFILSVPSTPITLGWFASELTESESVTLSWETATEVANAGFYLYALTEVDDENGNATQAWRLVSDEMVISQGDSTVAQRYELVTDVVADAYLLIDVSVTGKEVEHGPFLIGTEHGEPSNSQLIDWEGVNQESEGKKMQREEQRKNDLQQRLEQLLGGVMDVTGRVLASVLTAMVAPVEAAELLSFEVETAGVYEVTHQDLVGSGLDLQGVEINRLGLTEGGELWPFVLDTNGSGTFTESSRIVFPGRGLDSLYSGVNKYTLVIDQGQKLIEPDASALASDVAFAASYLGEKTYAPQNKHTFLSPEQDDSWFADTLNAVTTSAVKEVELEVDDYAPSISGGFGSVLLTQPTQDPELEVTVWGGSALPGDGVAMPDHQVDIAVQGELIDTMRFDGLQSRTARLPLAGIVNGTNRVTITVPVSNDYAYDLVRLDEVTIRYPRRFITTDDSLVFSSEWSKFAVRGLSSPEAMVIRVDDDGDAYLMTERGQTSASNRIYFAGSELGAQSTYFVSTDSGMKTPTISVSVSSSSLEAGPATYLVIAHPDFIGTTNQALEGYLAELESQYGSADLVDVEAIYSAYSGGVVDSMAIKDYIADAYANRGTRHVLLVGGDNFDYRDFSGQGAQSFIPSIYVPIASNVNAVPSDSSYVLIDDDLVPDLSIARLPVRNTQDLLDLIAKRYAYLSSNNQGDVLMAADKVDPSNYSFKSDAQRLIFDHFNDLNVDQVFLDDTDRESARTSITQSFNAGVNLVGYFGHSSTDRWAIDTIFTGDDAAALNNYATPSVVTQWGCWNTFYASPDNESMADRFLLSGQQGAVTVMGASSFTQAVAERRMAGYLFANLRNGMSIGEAVRDAKASIAQETPHQVDVLLGWAVLGFDDMVVFQ